MTGFERKRSAWQHNTGQDWKRVRNRIGHAKHISKISDESVTGSLCCLISPMNCFTYSHRFMVHAAEPGFQLPPYHQAALNTAKSCSCPAIRFYARTRDARKKKKRRKSHWSQMVLVKRRINRDKYQPIQYSPQPFHCKHQSMEERVLGGAAADCTPSLLQPLGYPKLVQTSIHPHHTFKQVWFNLKPTSRKGQTHYWHTGSLQGSDQNLTRKYKHPPVAHGALVIWGTPVRPFSPRQ